MGDTVEDKESDFSPYFFYDVLLQRIEVGDVCLMNSSAKYSSSRFEVLAPILIMNLRIPKRGMNKRELVIDYCFGDSDAIHNFVLFVEDRKVASFIVKVSNPEFYLDLDNFPNIISKKAQLISDLKR